MTDEIITCKEAGNLKISPSNQPFSLIEIKIAGDDIEALRSVCEVAMEYFDLCSHHGSDGDFSRETADRVKKFCTAILEVMP